MPAWIEHAKRLRCPFFNPVHNAQFPSISMTSGPVHLLPPHRLLPPSTCYPPRSPIRSRASATRSSSAASASTWSSRVVVPDCQCPNCRKGAQGSTLCRKAHGCGKRCVFEGCAKAIRWIDQPMQYVWWWKEEDACLINSDNSWEGTGEYTLTHNMESIDQLATSPFLIQYHYEKQNICRIEGPKLATRGGWMGADQNFYRIWSVGLYPENHHKPSNLRWESSYGLAISKKKP